MRHIGLIFICIALAASPGAAQQSRYSGSWGNPDAKRAANKPADETVTRLLDELQGLVDEAERGRAADPRFLGDLRSLARRYSWPWHNLVVFDDFSDGDATRNPALTIWGTGIAVYGNDGLSMRVRVQAPRLQPTPTGGRREAGDLASALIGSLLGQMAQKQDRRRGGRETPPSSTRQPLGEAGMKIAAAIPKAFAIRIALTSETRGSGRLILGVGQGAKAHGYRLAYNPGPRPSFDLLRVGSRGTAVIETVAPPVSLEDGARHVLQLTRDVTGEFAVQIDGEEVMRVRDRGLQGPFDSFILMNKGGTYTIRSVAVYGAG
jgi:hypothetical protein